MEQVLYADDERVKGWGGLSVTFLNEKGVKLVGLFYSEWKALVFARKLEHSRDCKLVATTGFIMR